MGFFDNILQRLGLGEDEHETPGVGATPELAAGVRGPMTAVAEPVATMTMVDVEAKLDKLARDSKPQLNWRTSIVDLLKLLDIDSSFKARRALATELHCPADLMDDSADMNRWLYKAVLRKIADNGGNVPNELLD